MSINNFDKILPLLKFRSEDDFYFLQIIQRKKDHPGTDTVTGSNNNNRIIKPYYIRSTEYLERKMPEIIALCDFFTARAGIDLNRRSLKKTAFHNLKKVTDQICNEDYDKVFKSYSSVCGKHSNETEKKWILDIDGRVLTQHEFNELSLYLETIQPLGPKIYARIPSNSGEHIISKPFNIQEFYKRGYSAIEIHKRNPTNIYIPDL